MIGSGRRMTVNGPSVVLYLAAALALALPAAVHAQGTTPVAGQNVNMVSGTGWPGGDPFLQRQNEPSIAVSSLNPLHLLAGANDYRTVDLPGLETDDERSDAWVGIFKSYNGGQTWQSTLLPGYPQDHSAAGNASPLKAYGTAADPTVRAGTGGLFYWSGIAFNRGTNNGAVFVATFQDQNNKENGDATANPPTDAIQYQGTVLVDTGTSGQFLDKPWIAVDIPRGGATCGTVYVAWSRFTGSNSTKIMISRSADCGKTWSSPTKLSESNSVNQGTVLAVDPLSGNVYAVWRRFATSSQTDAIVFAMSTDNGKTFSKSTDIASIVQFDQVTAPGQFRTNALPTMAVSVDGNQSFIHVAWAARQTTGGDARIVLSTSANGTTWTTPAAVDTTAILDDPPAGPPNSFNRGHQFMPQLTFTAGKLMLLYYDQRLDHTVGLFYPDGTLDQHATDGHIYFEERDERGELPASPDLVFTPTISDASLTQRRHTLDLRVAAAGPGLSPTFTAATVSRYPFGTRGDETNLPDRLEQLQFNPPNLPLFKQGEVPFLGDYIDIAGQTFLPPTAPGQPWRFNTAPAAAPVFYATWTSNQDVVPPLDGNWKNYTPVGGGATSLFDPAQSPLPCQPGQAGMRNQNIYMSRITQGVLVTSPQPSKPLKAANTTDANHGQRAFVIVVQNTTDRDRTFHLAVTPPAAGTASFVSWSAPGCASSGDNGVCPSLDVQIAAHSSIARSVFATSTNYADSMLVSVTEVGGDGLSASLTLNAEGTVPSALLQPDDAAGDISVLEIYNPFISSALVNPANAENAHVANAHVANAQVANAHVANAHVANAQVANAQVANAHVANPDIADAHVANAQVANANIADAQVANTSLAGESSITSAPVSDATFSVTNRGNTAHTYHVKLVGNAPPANVSLQLIITKTSATPYANGCTLELKPQNSLVANIVNPEVSAPDRVFDPNIPDSRISNATLALAPGESAAITLRGSLDPGAMSSLANQVWPRIIAHAGNNTQSEPYADPFVVTTSLSSLPPAIVGQPYEATLLGGGGKPPYTWSATGLPSSITINPATGDLSQTAAVLSGTAAAIGVYPVTITATDSSPTPQTVTLSGTFTVNRRSTTTTVTFTPSPAVVGQTVAVTATVSDTAVATPSASGTVAFAVGAGDTLSAGSCTLAGSSCSVQLVPSAPGSHAVTATFTPDTADAVHLGSFGTSDLGVDKAPTTTTILSAPASVVVGQKATVSWTVAVGPRGGGTPTGTVVVSSDDGHSCSGSAPAGSCDVPAWDAPGSHPLTAVYGGDSSFVGSSSPSPTTIRVDPAGSTTTITGVSPASPVYGQAVTVSWSVTAPTGSGALTGNVTVSDGSGGCAASAAAGSCSYTPASAGPKAVTASYSGDTNHTSSVSASPWPFTVAKAGTTIAITADTPDPSQAGQAVTVSFTVTPAYGGTPTGNVTVTDGSTASCTGTVATGQCSITLTTTGARSLTATYAGDTNFSANTSPSAPHQVNPAAYTFIGYLSPLTTATTTTPPAYSGAQNYSRALPIKWQLKNAQGSYVTALASAQTLKALFAGASCTAPSLDPTKDAVLYNPTQGAAGGSTFRYDTNTNQFIFNWDATKSRNVSGQITGRGCYWISLQLNDGSAAKLTAVLLQ